VVFVKKRIPLAALILFLSFLQFNCQSTQSHQEPTLPEASEMQTLPEAKKSEVNSTAAIELDQCLAAYVPIGSK